MGMRKSGSGEHYLNIDEEFAVIRGRLANREERIAACRKVLEPLKGLDRTVEAALAALDGVKS